MESLEPGAADANEEIEEASMHVSQDEPSSSGDFIGVVVDGPAMRRFAERLTRAGVVARQVTPDSVTEAQAGRLYLASAELAALAASLTRQSAHLCLIPPWPTGPTTIGAIPVSVAEAAQRAMARYTSSWVDRKPTIPAQPLRILYRERLIGEFSTTLVAAEAGEPLLALLPRVSNRHGYLFVATLQLSVASAQTQFEDVRSLVERLVAWCAAHAAPTRVSASEEAAALTAPGEEFAPLVTLSLALLLRGGAQAATDGAAASPSGARATLPLPRLRASFQRVTDALGLASPPTAFDLGWAWLVAHASEAFTTVDAATVAIDPSVVDQYCALWQLGPRLRRLL